VVQKNKKKKNSPKNKNGQLFFVHFENFTKNFFFEKSEKTRLEHYGVVTKSVKTCLLP